MNITAKKCGQDFECLVMVRRSRSARPASSTGCLQADVEPAGLSARERRPDSQPLRRQLGCSGCTATSCFGLRTLMIQKLLHIGTRGSQLALWQANWVKSALIERSPVPSVELVIIKTKGDKILDVPLAKVGGKGLFVKEIEEALLDKTDRSGGPQHEGHAG